jgi:phenylalanine-4-hydroxylase
MEPRWDRWANRHFLHGLGTLKFNPGRIPKLGEVNRWLAPLTGFRAVPVDGYIPAFHFFDHLRRREFPTVTRLRPADRLDYLPEPDIFHDVIGHVPMHTDRAFAGALVRFGECAHTAASLAAAIRDEEERERRLTSMIRAMARFFWFTIEFGLMRSGGTLRAYGSGLLSSYGELEYAIESPAVQRAPIHLDWVIHQEFEIDRYQPLLFEVESFDHLYELVDRLERWMRAGKLDRVSPGEPPISREDLGSFLLAAA